SCHVLDTSISFIFFFFQAEDGIRDRNVTGVQTCALPIFSYSFTGLGGSQTTAENGGGGITGTLTCGSCAGRGENHCFVCQGSGWDPLGEVCENCDGRGEVTCTACNGTGHL